MVKPPHFNDGPRVKAHTRPRPGRRTCPDAIGVCFQFGKAAHEVHFCRTTCHANRLWLKSGNLPLWTTIRSAAAAQEGTRGSRSKTPADLAAASRTLRKAHWTPEKGPPTQQAASPAPSVPLSPPAPAPYMTPTNTRVIQKRWTRMWSLPEFHLRGLGWWVRGGWVGAPPLPAAPAHERSLDRFPGRTKSWGEPPHGRLCAVARCEAGASLAPHALGLAHLETVGPRAGCLPKPEPKPTPLLVPKLAQGRGKFFRLN